MGDDLTGHQGRNSTAPNAPELSIVIPIHNEEEVLADAVTDLCALLRNECPIGTFELILSENGSSDGTFEAAASLAKRFPEVQVLSLGRPDYGRAMKDGFLAGSGAYLFNFDIDYYSIGFLTRALALLRTGECDIVIGSKRAPESVDRRPFARKLITLGFVTLLKLLFGLKAQDTHGIKGFNREKTLALVRQTVSGKDLFDTELVLRAEKAGLKIGHLPVVVEEHRQARSSILGRIPRTFAGLLSLRLVLWREAARQASPTGAKAAGK